MDNRPIGVFDSGIGGLTVLKELIEQLPGEDIVYFGDTARIPYGTRSKETVIKYVLESFEFLISKNIKAIVIACNTATALAIEEAKKQFDLPIIGVVEPGSRGAAQTTKNNIIGVIGTDGTINSKAYEKKIKEYLPDSKIIGIACPLFVPLVEEGWEDTRVADLVVEKYLEAFKKEKIDSLVLGCTHYPVLRKNIESFFGDSLKLVDPAYETAKRTKTILGEKNLLNEKKDKGKYSYYVSDDPDKFKRVGSRMIKSQIGKVEKISLWNTRIKLERNSFLAWFL